MGVKFDWIDMGISPANSGMTFEETKDLTCSFNFQLIAFTYFHPPIWDDHPQTPLTFSKGVAFLQQRGQFGRGHGQR